MIGVRPEHQGESLARILMDEVARMSASHPGSTGVNLNTEVESNVSFYEYLGYRTLGRRTVDDMETWCMFRPDD